MIRLVLAAVLSVALLATATAALEDARRSRSETLADGSVARVADTVTELPAEESSVTAWPDAARRVVEVGVPPGGIAETRVSYVAIGGVPGESVEADTDDGDVLAYRLAGGDPRVQRVPVDLRALLDQPSDERDRQVLAPDDEPLVFRSTTTVEFGLLQRRGRPVVVARRG